MLWQPELIKFEEQPDFPEADLTPGNAEIFGSYWLVKNPEVNAHATWLTKNHQSIYKVAYAAMKFNDVDVSDNPPDYMAFCIGFASLEWMSVMVRQGETQESKPAILRPHEYPMGAASAQVMRIVYGPRSICRL